MLKGSILYNDSSTEMILITDVDVNIFSGGRVETWISLQSFFVRDGHHFLTGGYTLSEFTVAYGDWKFIHTNRLGLVGKSFNQAVKESVELLEKIKIKNSAS